MAVGTFLAQGASMMLNTPRTEVGYVAAAVLGAVPGIADTWRSMLGGTGLQVSLQGVFCHGSPMVSFVSNGTPVQCELADLLVVVDRLSPRSGTRRAALIQAKMARAAGRVRLTGKSSVRQLRMYQGWPSFVFVDAVNYGSGTYLLGMHPGGTPGWFGVIDRHFKNGPYSPPPVWTQHPPSPTPIITTGGRTLGEFVTDAVFDLGAGCLVNVSATSDWDRLVNLLLRVTYAGLFRHSATLGPRSAGRGVTALAFRAASVTQEITPTWLMGGGTPPIDGAGDQVFEPAGSGISVLHVTVGRDDG